jgi:hypothetical protein
VIDELVGRYHEATDGVLAFAGTSDKAVHVHAGLAIYMLAQLALRTRRGSIDALLAVVLAEAANEALDRLFFGSWRWSDTLGDAVATLFWPAMLTVMSRYRRHRWERRRKLAARPTPPGPQMARSAAAHAGGLSIARHRRGDPT